MSNYIPIIPGPGNTLVTGSLPPTSGPSALVLGSAVPTSSSFAGTPGMVAFDTASFYICVDTNIWKKVALSLF